MESQHPRLGMFISYNEKNGKFEDAVEICNTQEYLAWLDNAAIQKQSFSLPTTILIKITGENRYYRGVLRDIKRAEEVDRAEILAEASHRPATWRAVDEIDFADFKSILYISGLKQVPRPAGIAKDRAPQRPQYVEEAVLRDFPPDELEQVRAEKEREGAFSSSGPEDARKRIMAAIVVRQGQGTFRAEVLDAYQRACAVTACDVVWTLEAAHIRPYLGPKTNEVSNGLLLRADIHTLFDLDLIALNPSDYRLSVSKYLKGSCYESLAGQLIRLPMDEADYPNREWLEDRLAKFQAKEAGNG